MQRLLLRFGPFRLDAADHLLLRDGNALALPPKAFDTLVYLAQNCRRLVTRDELIKAVWPNTFVADGSLSVNISLVRRILGEMEDGEPYIETVPRKGYRFRPEVIVEPVPEELPPAPVAPPAALGHKSRIKFWVVAGLIFSAVALGSILYIVQRRHPATPAFASMLISRLATRGSITGAALSPDGKYVVYASDDPQGQSLWTRRIATSSDIRILPAEPGDHSSLTFSPDSEYLYYIRKGENGERNLYRMPMLGGDPSRVLAGVTGPISLSPDAKRFAFIRIDPSRWDASLMVANVDGSGLRQIESRRRPRYFSLTGLAWSSDGHSLFCFAGNASYYDAKAFHLIRVQEADGSESDVTSQSWTWVGPVIRADGDTLLFLASTQADDALQIWKTSVRDGRASRITNDLSNYTTLSVAVDGKTLAAVRVATTADVWVAFTHDIDHPVPITSSHFQGLRSLTWTPDGRIVYSSRGPESLDIFRLSKGGHDLKQLTAGPGSKAEAALTRDGRYMLYQFRGNIWRMDSDGANPLQLTFGAHDVHPMPSGDSLSVIYASFANWSPAIGGRPALWTVPIMGGQPRQLTQLPTSVPRISPDGNLIACAYFPAGDPRYSQRQIAVFAFAAGRLQPQDRPLKVFNRPPSGNDTVCFSPDGKGLDYIVPSHGVGNIWRQPLDGNTPVQLTHFVADDLFDFDWSQDQRQLAMARGAAVKDLVLIRDSSFQ